MSNEMIENLTKNEDRYKYGCGFTLNSVKVTIFSEIEEVVNELSYYLSIEKNEGNSIAEYRIYIIHDTELDVFFRSVSSEKNTVMAKSDIAYKTSCYNDFSIYVSDYGFDGHHHSILKKGSEIYIVLTNYSEGSLRTPLRVLREVVLRESENVGACLVHAAMVEFESRAGVMVLGAKGAGKTTTMIKLISAGAAYVANDKCIVKNNNRSIQAYGWPMAIRLGMGLVESTFLNIKGGQYIRMQKEKIWTQRYLNDEDCIENWANREKLELTPLEISKEMHCKVNGSGPVDCLILPNLKIGGGDISLSRVDGSSYYDEIRGEICEPEDKDYLVGWLGIRKIENSKLNDAADQLARDLTKKTIFTLKGDPRRFPTDNRAIVETIMRGLSVT